MRVRIFSALVLTLALAGCSALLGDAGASSPVPSEAAPDAGRCAELLTELATPADVPGVTLLMADRSASTVGARGRERQDWAKLLVERVPTTTRTLLRSAVFGGDVRWQAGKLTPGPSSNEHQNRYAAEDMAVCLRRDLDKALEQSPGAVGSDVLRALAEAGEELGEIKGSKRIVIATDGLSNMGCADLRAAPIGDDKAIDDVVRACRHEIPALDKSVQVELLGLGQPAQGQPDVRPSQQKWLRTLWWRLCAATGATCLRPSSKTPESLSLSRAAGTRPDPAVEMPAIKVERGDPTVITVPESVLFDTDSYRLAPRAQEAIADVMKYVEQIDHTRIEVRGHTDAEGTPEHNQKLSDRRAASVVAALRAKGATRLEARGFGERRPRCRPQYRDGVADRVAMACNRRVEVVIYGGS
ncbi:OmpA family protein [Nonomuraea sp. NPDC050540]|uniref:OmpA family protein n=1 Tax=Nonomuraea sp. NPDC050540 TaxID=3364367 RepID=UPI003798EC2D